MTQIINGYECKKITASIQTIVGKVPRGNIDRCLPFVFLQIEVICILSITFLNTKDFRKKGKKSYVNVSEGQIYEINKQNSCSLFFCHGIS